MARQGGGARGVPGGCVPADRGRTEWPCRATVAAKPGPPDASSRWRATSRGRRSTWREAMLWHERPRALGMTWCPRPGAVVRRTPADDRRRPAWEMSTKRRQRSVASTRVLISRGFTRFRDTPTSLIACPWACVAPPVRAMTGVRPLRPDEQVRLVAAMPSITGISLSVTMTLNGSRLAEATAGTPAAWYAELRLPAIGARPEIRVQSLG